MVYGFTKGKYVKHVQRGVFGTITEHSDKYGWIRVAWDDKVTKTYSTEHIGTLRRILLPVSATERADYFLALENAGITNYWSD